MENEKSLKERMYILTLDRCTQLLKDGDLPMYRFENIVTTLFKDLNSK
jgi:hypothetical protein